MVLLAICVAALLSWHRWWPFEEKSVIEDLQQAADSGVQIHAFHKTYFPHPGCVLDGVVFTHRQSHSKPLMTVERITIQGSYLGILAHHLSTIQADGLHIFVPAFGTGQALHSQGSKITIGEIIANNATVEFASRNQRTEPLRFEIHQATLRHVGASQSLTYDVKLHNPQPPGEISATGSFGPFNDADTHLSGHYKFDQANLGVFDNIGGTLSSIGKFSGTLTHIDISGTTDVPDFIVKDAGHPLPLHTEFTAYVDGMHGDTFLQRVDASFRKTHLFAKGSIARDPSAKGKITQLEFRTNQGRIEDLLLFFVKADRPPMYGAMRLSAKVAVPSGQEQFLKRVRLQGDFGITGGGFTKSSTQKGVNRLSSGALGEKNDSEPQTAPTDLSGVVDLREGIAAFSELVFHTPGATARMQGTFNVIDHKIDLRGPMHVDSKISNTTSGAKSFLLKVMDPFFKKRHHGEEVPVHISGTYEKPQYGLDLNDKQNKAIARRLTGQKKK